MINFLESFVINGYPLIYVPWNVFLALIPVFVSYYLYKKFKSKKIKNFTVRDIFFFGSLFVVWFFFFPNTTYLFTEVRYIVNYCPEVTKLRICANQTFIPPFFFLYALIGIPTFVYSLRKISELMSRLFDEKLSIIFPIIMIPISAIGIMLGLVGRFNSWDIILKPIQVITVSATYFTELNKVLGILAYSILMYIIYYYFKNKIK